MDKNTLTGLILIAILWVAMIAYNGNQKKKLQEENGGVSITETVENQDKNIGDIQDVLDQEAATQEAVPSTPKNDSIHQAQINSSFGPFASFINIDGETYTTENEEVIYTFNTKGGFLEKVELKRFKKFNQKPLLLFDYTRYKGSFGFEFAASSANQAINTKDLTFQVSEKTIDGGGKEITFSIPISEGKQLSQVYKIPAKGYLFDMNLKLDGFNDVIRPNAKYLNVHWDQTFPRQELSQNDERINSTVYYRYTDGDVGNIKVRKEGIEKLKTDVNWISFKQKFFNSTMISEENFENGKVSTENPSAAEEDSIIKYATAQMTIPFDGSAAYNYPFQFYMGPNNYRQLKKLDLGLQNIVPLGKFIFGWVNKGLIIPVFSFLNRYIGNYGVIILFLTILIKIIITPFTYKSYMSMLKMKVLKPEIDELKEKYGKDQQKFGQAQMALFRKAGVNPLGGCLPMLFQMPILIAMYRFFPASIELRQAKFLWADDLSTYDSILQLPFTIPQYGDHVSLFTILMAITSFFYTRMNSANTDTSGPMGAQMKMFQYFMPFMLLFIFNKFSAGLSYYYFLFNLLSVLQQLVMKKFFIDEDKIHAKIQENKKKPVKQSKFQARLEKMMKEQQEVQKKRQSGKKKK